jgi:hypothetical protein
MVFSFGSGLGEGGFCWADFKRKPLICKKNLKALGSLKSGFASARVALPSDLFQFWIGQQSRARYITFQAALRGGLDAAG